MPRWSNHERKDANLTQPARDRNGVLRSIYFGKLAPEADRLAAESTAPGQSARERVAQITRAECSEMAPIKGENFSEAVRDRVLQTLRTSLLEEIARVIQ